MGLVTGRFHLDRRNLAPVGNQEVNFIQIVKYPLSAKFFESKYPLSAKSFQSKYPMSAKFSTYPDGSAVNNKPACQDFTF